MLKHRGCTIGIVLLVIVIIVLFITLNLYTEWAWF
jgi:hypothetical protein